ncbi:hypothetical protein ONS95_012366 [Cadophora gregata]|uniref:uncharacterized protein n=1 Tax=Cadophora gregata TaxID=51156 RepID=UPI0026DC0AC4|nr:uncharacterized protein ONS95_012366 [Cadophora gregata]KAK0118057.1 hypothetical protein ONS95_012366 [Cadophora gregata]
MYSSTDSAIQKCTQPSQTSPPASNSTRTPSPKRTPRQIRQSNVATALSYLLGLLFFTLIIHACVRSVSNSKPKHRNDNDGPVLGAILSFIPVAFLVVGIVTSLDEVAAGLAGQSIVITMSAAVAGLAWVVFGVGTEATFPIYLAWVMWPVVGAFMVVVLGASVWAYGFVEAIEDENEGNDRKGRNSD